MTFYISYQYPVSAELILATIRKDPRESRDVLALFATIRKNPWESRGALAIVATIRQDPWESRGALAFLVAAIRKDPRESRGVPQTVGHSRLSEIMQTCLICSALTA